jgi:hypothetical protein
MNRRKDGNEKFNLDLLLHPARAFKRPADVLADSDLTISEKRAILASWASDACAVEARNERAKLFPRSSTISKWRTRLTNDVTGEPTARLPHGERNPQTKPIT